MYVAKAGGKNLTFEASGKLWQDALVMEDDQTGSLWSQISGECIKGDLIGEKLELFPSQFKTFEAVRNQPDIKFLIKPEKGPNQSVYKDYFENRGRMGIFGTMYSDTLLEGKDLIFGIRGDHTILAVPQELFKENPVYIVPLDDIRLILLSDDDNFEVACFQTPFSADSDVDVTVDENNAIVVSSPEFDNIIFENGRQVSGPKLKPYPITTAYWFAWKAFFPETEVFQPKK